MKVFGLVGKNIGYSFSKSYFSNRFLISGESACYYHNFDIVSLNEFPNILNNTLHLKGLNVTIPFKESIIPYLNNLSDKARQIGAVNVIKITSDKLLIGYNTDYYGFKKSLQPLLKSHHTNALILGTGGASKAVAFALDELGISYQFVSRTAKENTLSYKSLTELHFKEHTILVNTTPLGTSPDIDLAPEIPYHYVTEQHIAFDLIYNPEETLFLKKAKLHGAITKNGLEMLILQAEKAWEIWNE